MHWLCWILGILGLLLVWLCLTRVGVRAEMTDGVLTLNAKIGLFHLRLFPKKKQEKTTKVSKKEKAEKPPKKGAFPKLTLTDIKDLVRTLAPPLKLVLGRTRRGIRLHPLCLSLTLGGREDPAVTAELYGYLHTGMWTVMPQLERLLDIPDPRLHIGMDFDAGETTLEGRGGISIRIGTLLAVGFTIAIPALKWFLRYRKKQQTMPPAPSAAKA